jgi:hypothetical protein
MRHRVQQKLWYLAKSTATGTRRFATWPDSHTGIPLYGLAQWAGRGAVESQNRQRWRTDPRELCEGVGHTKVVDVTPQLVEEILKRVGSPVEMDELTDGLMKLLGIHEVTLVELEEADRGNQQEISPDLQIDRHGPEDPEFAHELWKEISSLPLNQRRAFLLHQERDVLLLFIGVGSCTQRGIADALEMTVGEYLERYQAMPIPDKQTAAWLGMTARDVINLRKCATERLRRRLGKWKESLEPW